MATQSGTRYTGFARSKAAFLLQVLPCNLFFEQEEDGVLTGKRFKLTERILGIEVLDGERKGISIPAGAMIEVMRAPSDGAQTLDVLWNKRELNVLACDLRMRGKECIAEADTVLGLQ